MKENWLNPYDNIGISRIIVVSIGLHLIAMTSFFIYPLFSKKPSEPVVVMEIVSLEKPKIRLNRPKTVNKIEENPVKKIPTPKYTNRPKLSKKNIPKRTTSNPDSSVKRSHSQESHQVRVPPRIVMPEMGDPRLRFWANRIVRIFKTQWNPPRGFGILNPTEINVGFTVERSGKIRSPNVEKSSGNKVLDEFTLNVVERVGRLPPIPPNYREKDRLTLEMIFKYQGD